jgi:ankyrin repeat protein
MQADAAARIQGLPGIVDAVLNGDLAVVQEHLVADASCVGCRQDFSNDTPLHVSAERGHLEISRLLLQCKADPQAKKK